MPLVHLLERSVYAMPSLVSGNWAQVALAVFIFFAALAITLIVRGWDAMKKHLLENLLIGVAAVAVGWTALFLYSIVVTIYNDHHDVNGRWKAVVSEKNSLKAGLQERDTEIRKLRDQIQSPQAKRPIVTYSAPRSIPNLPNRQPQALSELQTAVLRRDLAAGAGQPMRLVVLGSSQDTLDFGEEIRQAFKGWIVDVTNVGAGGTPGQTLEFVIPNPQDKSVSIAVHAFDHAKIPYAKNIFANAYRGPLSLGPAPPLTIIVR